MIIILASSENLFENWTKGNEMIVLVACLSLLCFINVKHEEREEVAFLFCNSFGILGAFSSYFSEFWWPSSKERLLVTFKISGNWFQTQFCCFLVLGRTLVIPLHLFKSPSPICIKRIWQADLPGLQWGLDFTNCRHMIWSSRNDRSQLLCSFCIFSASSTGQNTEASLPYTLCNMLCILNWDGHDTLPQRLEHIHA